MVHFQYYFIKNFIHIVLRSKMYKNWHNSPHNTGRIRDRHIAAQHKDSILSNHHNTRRVPSTTRTTREESLGLRISAQQKSTISNHHNTRRGPSAASTTQEEFHQQPEQHRKSL